MKRLIIASLCVFTLASLAKHSFSQDFDYSKYKPRTLSELIELNPGPPKSKEETKLAYISGEGFYSQVRLKYIGTSRPMSPEHKEILNNWKTSFKMPDETVKLFQNEFLFKECGVEHWIPVQQQVSTYFAKELKEGDMVTLYLFLAGGLRTTGKVNLLFLVNEFEK